MESAPINSHNTVSIYIVDNVAHKAIKCCDIVVSDTILLPAVQIHLNLMVLIVWIYSNE